MSLINFKDIDCKKSINTESTTIGFNGSEITVVSYLPTHEKYQLIMSTLAKSNDNGIFNPLLRKMHFLLNIAYMYSSIVFDAEDRADEEGLFDTLSQSGLLGLIIEAIPEDEIDILETYLQMTEEKINQYNAGFNGIVDKVIRVCEDLPEKMEKALEIFKDLDLTQLQEMLNSRKETESEN